MEAFGKLSKSGLMEPIPEKTREHLENERHRINEEIRNYPTPIAGCDAQFNYLKRRAGEDRSGIGSVEGRSGQVDTRGFATCEAFFVRTASGSDRVLEALD